MPMAIPIGVTRAKGVASRSFLAREKDGALRELGLSGVKEVCSAAGGSSSILVGLRSPSWAMRVPRAMPSNTWWKRMTTKRVRKKLSPATTSVIPMTGDFSVTLAGKNGELTNRVKNDTTLKHQNSDGLDREAWHRGRVGGGPGHDEALAEILDQERQEETGHDNGRRGGLVLKLAQAFVAEHELSMCV